MLNTDAKPRMLKPVKIALMLAISTICMLWLHFPILPAASFLELEISDIPILIAGFAFGPIWGLAIGVVSILLRALILSAPSGAYGMVMHIIAIGVFVLVSSGICHKWQSTKWNGFTLILGYSITEKRALLEIPLVGLLSLVIGGLCMTLAMLPANIIVIPLFMDVPVETAYEMIAPVLIPFNLLKVVLDIVVVFFLYKRVSPFLLKWGQPEQNTESSTG